MEWERIKTFGVAAGSARPQQVGYGLDGEQAMMDMGQPTSPDFAYDEQGKLE